MAHSQILHLLSAQEARWGLDMCLLVLACKILRPFVPYWSLQCHSLAWWAFDEELLLFSRRMIFPRIYKM